MQRDALGADECEPDVRAQEHRVRAEVGRGVASDSQAAEAQRCTAHQGQTARATGGYPVK